MVKREVKDEVGNSIWETVYANPYRHLVKNLNFSLKALCTPNCSKQKRVMISIMLHLGQNDRFKEEGKLEAGRQL